MKTDREQGVRKDIGTGVFRDRDGDIIPRRRFEEDPDFDIEVPDDEIDFQVYRLRLAHGMPRDPEIEAGLDPERLAKLLAGGRP
jgi:hypothetical protein